MRLNPLPVEPAGPHGGAVALGLFTAAFALALAWRWVALPVVAWLVWALAGGGA